MRAAAKQGDVCELQTYSSTTQFAIVALFRLCSHRSLLTGLPARCIAHRARSPPPVCSPALCETTLCVTSFPRRPARAWKSGLLPRIDKSKDPHYVRVFAFVDPGRRS